MKTILITGASSGFGRKLAIQLAATRQYNIVAALRNPASQSSAELAQLPHVHVRALDVTRDEDVALLMEDIESHYGSVDILVNNAGVFGGGLLEAHSIKQVQHLFDVNTYGPLRLMKAVLPGMREKGEGLIINVSSMLGFFSIPLNAVYCASKFALEALVEGSYAELMHKGVENILIEPGTFPTELYQKTGVKADLADVTASYGGWAEQMAAYSNQKVYEAIQKHQPDPQTVVDKIVTLIEMPKGTRPLRSPIDAISGDAFAQKVAQDLAERSHTQMKAYGF